MGEEGWIGGLGWFDLGGMDLQEKIDTKEHPLSHWEKETHALLVLLAQKGLTSTDEHRRAMESLPAYTHMSYYHRWAACIAAVCIERNTFTKNELDEYLGLKLETKLEPSFSPGSLVRIKMEDSRIRWRKPHLRVPGYIFGSSGEIIKHLGNFPNPEQAAFYTDTTTIQPLYLVQLRMNEVWKNYPVYGDSTDLLTVEVYEPWLELQNENSGSDLQDEKVSRDFPEHHVLDHGDHVHDDRKDTEVESVRREECEERKDEYGVVLSRAVLNLLVSKGLVNRAEVQASIEKRDKISGLNLGQRIVVKAWMDPEFKVRLLEDGNKGVAELGLEGSNPNAETKLVVVENTDQEHHVVVCTLCLGTSCSCVHSMFRNIM
ncbi:uncharacterized protein LOC111705901 isoform X3 [Eurytemora carolleeae]|uniref:uncharacterized protein LOC111705901 isoform X3 n=1 Tax=Eurytemora carolleeae TaxID=1294199 RepID=UPI000C7589AE|nr:uncharacterized protein LOC111705901 isoform X3 [Eurytemora carolleeae]|eukprot:XP_023334371.1 uncharacterized protein LOC111705901 isoform X3 [Eurytemora affinis]